MGSCVDDLVLWENNKNQVRNYIILKWSDFDWMGSKWSDVRGNRIKLYDRELHYFHSARNIDKGLNLTMSWWIVGIGSVRLGEGK
jgi:hypothetical protein